ncbi:MAG TPA: cysteine desulfurase family protein [Pelomicrobium sp.]|nr:cysteine desulfurase family protein [Pelomicrobium sp.]
MTHVYLDHNATTPVDERVLEAMLPYFSREFGNPSSRHEFGTRARRAVDLAREQVADAVRVQPAQVTFVSTGSEANNLFMKGAAAYLKPSQLAVSAVEHSCVANPAKELARGGWRLRRIAVDGEGRLDLADLDAALAEPTGLVAVMLANNETGVILDVAAVADKARARGAWVHTDAVQALGKIPLDFKALKVHSMSLAAHKLYGPKGAGALILDKRVSVQPLVHGGGHEQGLRSGTENVPAIVGFGMACQIAKERQAADAARLQALRAQLEERLRATGAVVFGEGAERLPNTTFFGFEGITGETLVIELDRVGFAAGTGSACSSGSPGSPVLLAMGYDTPLARSGVRASLGRSTTADEVAGFADAVERIADRLKRLSAVAV